MNGGGFLGTSEVDPIDKGLTGRGLLKGLMPNDFRSTQRKYEVKEKVAGEVRERQVPRCSYRGTASDHRANGAFH